MAYTPDYDYLFKLVMIGDTGVGKTSLNVGYSSDQYPPPVPSIYTICVNFIIRKIVVESKTIKLQIWDPTARERFRFVPPSYYRGTSGI